MATPIARSPKVRPVNLTIDKEALVILHQGASTKKNLGQFVSRLLYEHRAREEARQEMLGQVYHVQDDWQEK